MNTPKVVITHHTGGTDQYPLLDSSHHTVDIVNRWHKSRWPGFVSRRGYHVGYHYFIEKNGRVTQTREHDEEGAHCIGMNRSSIGVCFAGNFDVTYPTKEQIEAWNVLYNRLEVEFPSIPTYPHRRYATKSCHGRLLADDYFAKQKQIFDLWQQVYQLRALLANLITRKRLK
jgi:hypothetical protein